MTRQHHSRKNGANTGDVGPGKPPIATRFKPGNSGRPKGSRNRLGEDFLQALCADWAEHGPDVLKKVREDRPHEYLKVVASLLPKQLDVAPGGELDHLSYDELRQQIIDEVRTWDDLDGLEDSLTEH